MAEGDIRERDGMINSDTRARVNITIFHLKNGIILKHSWMLSIWFDENIYPQAAILLCPYMSYD